MVNQLSKETEISEYKILYSTRDLKPKNTRQSMIGPQAPEATQRTFRRDTALINITKLWCGMPGSMDQLRYGSDTHKKPVVVWNTTRRCNLSCMHCYSKSENKVYPNELTSDEAKALIKDLSDFGVKVLLFSGGDPLLRSDLLENHASLQIWV